MKDVIVKSESLCKILSTVVPGPITDPEITKQVATALERCFREFTTKEHKELGPRKIRRMENPVWSSPVLEFDLERHGRTVLGSTMAEIQTWKFDISTKQYEEVKSTDYGHKRTRVVRKRSNRFDHKSAASRVASLIQNREDAEELEWKDANKVKILIGTIVPETNQQTTAARRKKFWSELEELLKAQWKRENQFLVRIAPTE